YHQRLYTLDRQVDHAQSQIVDNLGLWLIRRTLHTEKKFEDANVILQRCGYSKEYLREQWMDQVKAQTKPLPRQSRSAGKDAQERELNKILLNHATEPDVHADTIQELAALRNNIRDIDLTISKKSELLGVSDRTRLQKLINNPFYAARVNAIALKMRLQDRLRSRKFEMERVERSFRKQVN
ncbi:hypothetical protein H0H92_015217, partial [Tricholoma furcatifolium]